MGDERIDTLAPNAAQRLRELFGPVISVHVFPGVGNAAELLATGLILLGSKETDTLESLMVCFDARDASPYPAFVVTPAFTGDIQFDTLHIRGSEDEASLLRQPGASGIAGLIDVRTEGLSLGFFTKKRLGRFGKRTGRRRLVLLIAEWGGVKPFPPRRRAIAAATDTLIHDE